MNYRVSIRIVLEKVWKVAALAAQLLAQAGFNPHRIGEGLESNSTRFNRRRTRGFQSASYWRRSGKTETTEHGGAQPAVSIRIVLEKVWKAALAAGLRHIHRRVSIRIVLEKVWKDGISRWFA